MSSALTSETPITSTTESPLRLVSPAADGPPPGRFVDRLAVTSLRRVLVVRTDEVDWIAAEGNYVRLHRERGSHLLRETMKQLERTLDPSEFARIHRSAFVRLDRVREIARLSSGALHLMLRSGQCLALSRRYRRSFLHALFPGSHQAFVDRFDDYLSGDPSVDPTS